MAIILTPCRKNKPHQIIKRWIRRRKAQRRLAARSQAQRAQVCPELLRSILKIEKGITTRPGEDLTLYDTLRPISRTSSALPVRRTTRISSKVSLLASLEDGRAGHEAYNTRSLSNLNEGQLLRERNYELTGSWLETERAATEQVLDKESWLELRTELDMAEHVVACWLRSQQTALSLWL